MIDLLALAIFALAAVAMFVFGVPYWAISVALVLTGLALAPGRDQDR